MQIAFSSLALRSCCENREQATRELGSIAASNLRGRLADILSARVITDLPVGSPRFIGKGKNQNFVLNLSDEVCLEASPNLLDKGTFVNNSVNWQRVMRIKIVRIGVCND